MFRKHLPLTVRGFQSPRPGILVGRFYVSALGSENLRDPLKECSNPQPTLSELDITMPKKPKKTPGRPAERLVVEGPWQSAVGSALAKGKPPKASPKKKRRSK